MDHRQGAIKLFPNVLDGFSSSHVEVGPIEYHVPKRQQMFFREFRFLELSIHRKLNRASHHQFLARILCDGAANFVAFQRDISQLLFNRAQRRADTAGTGSNNQHIEEIGHIRSTERSVKPLRNCVNAVTPLVYSILDQRQAAQFSDDKQIWHGCFKFWGETRHVGAHAGTCHHHGDRSHGACFGA